MSNVIGQIFGRLTVLSPTKWRYSHQYYMCRCECGRTKEARMTDLKRGVTVSCGCWKTLPRKRRTA